MTADLHLSPVRVSLRELYEAAYQDANGRLVIGLETLEAWAQRETEDTEAVYARIYESGRQAGIAEERAKKDAPGAASGRMYPDSERYRHFKASQRDADYYGLSEAQRFIEVRYFSEQGQEAPDQWEVDEIVTSGLHLEGMDTDSVWMNVKGLHVWFRAERVKGQRKLKLVVTCFPNECTPVVITPGMERGDGLTVKPGAPSYALEPTQTAPSPADKTERGTLGGGS